MIKDSGARTEFRSGAVRDIKAGVGRCDLLPLGEVAYLLDDEIIRQIGTYQESGCIMCIKTAFEKFVGKTYPDMPTAMIELSKHFEEGAKKYKENNWRSQAEDGTIGIPESSYIDSAVRHYLKTLRGDTDEDHARAFLWNLICLMWQHRHGKSVD